MLDFELLYLVVHHGQGSNILQEAKRMGVLGGTIYQGYSIHRGSLSDLLCLNQHKKELILIGDESSRIQALLHVLKEDLLENGKKGSLAFTIPVLKKIGARKLEEGERTMEERTLPMYQQILSIVNYGRGEEVVKAARKAGATGATVIHARGSGIHENQKLFHLMDIEPEKEMVMIIAKKEATEAIVDSIRKDLDIDQAGKGVIFVQDVAAVYGLDD